MAAPDDWRLQGQEDYPKGVLYLRRRYTHYPEWNAEWDHDHCEFCWAKFMDRDDVSGVLREGYTNAEQVINGTVWREGARWICPQCFQDFRQRFDWTVADETPQ